MTKKGHQKRSSEILADEKTYFRGKSHAKVSRAKFFLESKIFCEIGGNASLSQGDGRP